MKDKSHKKLLNQFISMYIGIWFWYLLLLDWMFPQCTLIVKYLRVYMEPAFLLVPQAYKILMVQLSLILILRRKIMNIIAMELIGSDR